MVLAYYITPQGAGPLPAPPDNLYGAIQAAQIDARLLREGVYSQPENMSQGLQSLIGFQGDKPPIQVLDEIEEFERQVEGLDSTMEWFCAQQGLLAMRGLVLYLRDHPELGDTYPAQQWLEYWIIQLEILALGRLRWHLEVYEEEGEYEVQDREAITASVCSHSASHYCPQQIFQSPH